MAEMAKLSANPKASMSTAQMMKLSGVTNSEQAMMTTMQRIQAKMRHFFLPIVSETYPTRQFEMIAATLFHVCSATASEAE